MAATSWVIGRGLLGNAIAEQLGGDVFRAAIPWSAPDETAAAFRSHLRAFLDGVGDGAWSIHWCAGRAVTSATREVLAVEVATFRGFLAALHDLAPAERARGAVFLASSVGGAWGGSSSPPFTESTPVWPASEYGRAKLEMEDALRATTAATGIRSVTGRITNIYGPGQDLSKGQGLISVLAATYLTGQPARVFVSLDTLRDYVYVDDCAKLAIAALDRVRREPEGASVTKILGSMRAVSIGALIGEFSRVRKHRPLIVLGAGPSVGQALDLRVRSEVWRDLDGLASTTLASGIHSTLEHMRRLSV